MTKDFEIEFLIDGKKLGSSTLTVMGKTLLTHAAEDEFFAMLRKNEKRLVQEAEDEEREQIIDNLTPAQEEKLQAAHMEDEPMTLDDDLPDAYEAWLMDLDLADLKRVLFTNEK
jgi:hypothetical protein